MKNFISSPIKKILVALDASPLDDSIFEYARFIVDAMDVEKVYFVNTIKNFNLPDEIKDEFPELIDKAINDRKEKLTSIITKWFKDVKVDQDIIVQPDQTTKFIMEFAQDNDLDLIILGRKHTLPSSGVTVPRLARRASCSLLIVPENSHPNIKNTLVPIDFSDYSRIALEHAIRIASLNHSEIDVDIVCQNVYNVPAGYHFTGKSFEEFDEIMREHAKKNYEKFIKDIPTENSDFKTIYSLDKNDNLTSEIYDQAKEHKADLIIIGAKGRTTTAALLLGSFAEKLINTVRDIPLMITRPKGKKEGIIDYIKEI